MDPNKDKDDVLQHYGMPKRSGRYPWGSGDIPFQRSGDFLSRVSELKKQGLKETEIATALGFIDPKTGRTQTTKLRTQIGLAKNERRSTDVAAAKGLAEKGLNSTEISEKLGIAESTIRSLLNEDSEARMNRAQSTANFLKKQIDEKGMIDVGVGVERELNVSREKLNQALYILEREGYPVYGGGVPQVTNPGKQTNLKVICPPGTEHKEIYNFDKVNSIRDYVSHDDGETFDKFVYPKSMDSKRVKIKYAEEGGIDKDGLVEIRRGVEDLSLGNSHYAQVRILVDDKKYIKGMAAYSDDMPDGYDIVFNTNKKIGTPKEKVLKDITADPDNPFGSSIKAGGQSYYIDKNGKRQLSLINKRAEEGDWTEWSDSLPSQMLSKQNITLIKKQLNLASADKQAEFDEIMALTNPTVKKNLLKSFSDDCDSTAVHLQAAALPRQKYHVILPIPSLKDTEVYAPNYNNGEKVALIRYPHGGTFEIPILTVNNKHAQSKKVLGTNPVDAIGINKNIADRLSGADFDGDTVMLIPTNSKVKITSTPPLKGLEGFDPKMEYPERPGMRYMKTNKTDNTQVEMGKISNLITDMTLLGASQDELARAVKHSMVVIDAGKHKLDYKKSEEINGIASLKKKYQGSYDKNGNYHEGASTLISRAKSQVSVPKRRGNPNIDPVTGEQSYAKAYTVKQRVKEINEEYIDRDTGKIKSRMQRSTKMAETDDAYSLVSNAKTPQEMAYAEYANKMKSLANQARKEMLRSGKIKYDSSAKTEYQKEVDRLSAALNVALKNAPRERQAQTLANASIKAKIQANPDMKPGEIKKAKQQALNNARLSVGASRETIHVSDREWEAIQKGAISENKLSQIILNMDADEVRKRATPRTTTTLSEGSVNKIKAMKESGYSTAEIAAAIGKSSTTVLNYLNGKG